MTGRLNRVQEFRAWNDRPQTLEQYKGRVCPVPMTYDL